MSVVWTRGCRTRPPNRRRTSSFHLLIFFSWSAVGGGREKGDTGHYLDRAAHRRRGCRHRTEVEGPPSHQCCSSRPLELQTYRARRPAQPRPPPNPKATPRPCLPRLIRYGSGNPGGRYRAAFGKRTKPPWAKFKSLRCLFGDG